MTLEVEGVVASGDDHIKLGKAREHVALELRHLAIADGETRLVMGEIAEHEAERVPELAVGFDIGLDDVLADAQILGVVGAHGPDPQDLCAGLADHILRRHHIAERLRHFAPVLVHYEAVGDHGVIRRAAARAARFQ